MLSVGLGEARLLVRAVRRKLQALQGRRRCVVHEGPGADCSTKNADRSSDGSADPHPNSSADCRADPSADCRVHFGADFGARRRWRP